MILFRNNRVQQDVYPGELEMLVGEQATPSSPKPCSCTDKEGNEESDLYEKYKKVVRFLYFNQTVIIGVILIFIAVFLGIIAFKKQSK